MDGLWIVLFVAFAIISGIMKRREKPQQRTDRAPSQELRKYLQRVEEVLLEQTGDEPDMNRRVMREKEVPSIKLPPRVEETRPVVVTPKRSAPPVQHHYDVPRTPDRRSSGAANEANRERQKKLREAIIWSEVLQPPVSKRKR